MLFIRKLSVDVLALYHPLNSDLCVGTPYDLSECEHPETRPHPGHKFTIFHQLRYFYTNHLDVQLPVSIATDLIPRDRSDSSENLTDSSSSKLSSSLPVKPVGLSEHTSNCTSVGQYEGLLLWACGPNLSTLGEYLCLCDNYSSY